MNTVADIVLTPPQDLAKRCRVSSSEISQLIRDICQNQGSLQFTFRTFEHTTEDDPKTLTLGDVILDAALGGGLRTGMIWEIVGERYGCLHLYIPTRNCLTHSERPKCCRKDAICSTNFLVCPASRNTRRTRRISLLPDDKNKTSNSSTFADSTGKKPSKCVIRGCAYPFGADCRCPFERLGQSCSCVHRNDSENTFTKARQTPHN